MWCEQEDVYFRDTEFEKQARERVRAESRKCATLFAQKERQWVECAAGRARPVLESEAAAFHLQDRATLWQSHGVAEQFYVIVWNFGELQLSYDPEMGRAYACNQTGVWMLMLRDGMVANFVGDLKGIAWRADGLWLQTEGPAYWRWF